MPIGISIGFGVTTGSGSGFGVTGSGFGVTYWATVGAGFGNFDFLVWQKLVRSTKICVISTLLKILPAPG